MAELVFEDLSFEDNGDSIRINFMNIFYTDVPREEIEKIGPFKVERKKIIFSKATESKARRKFNQLLAKSFTLLKNKIAQKNSFYIHKNSGIPLLGTNYFGIIDRGSNIIEIKPLTSCNLGCIFCSVDEGPTSRRKMDFVVEKDYIFQEFKKLVEFKNVEGIDAHINSQGEPLLYADIVPLVKDIAKIKQVSMISIDTNGTLLSKKMVDDLAGAGLTRINLSLHSLDQELADRLYGSKYPLKHVLAMARYIPQTKMDLILTPVFLPGYNDDELVKLAKFAKEIGAGKNGPAIGIQNFLPYRFGRNPVKPMDLDKFFVKLKDLEKEHDLKLIWGEKDFKVVKCEEYPKPFKRGQTVEVKLAFPGRLNNEMMGVAEDRLIAIPSCYQKEGSVKVRIKRTKHNIFIGELLN
ncbi:radical SAM protein [Candidatus Woesearchaeota archaeon]|nr:radical SAM protein [Candidatus Woesearchaeota archaeon]